MIVGFSKAQGPEQLVNFLIVVKMNGIIRQDCPHNVTCLGNHQHGTRYQVKLKVLCHHVCDVSHHYREAS